MKLRMQVRLVVVLERKVAREDMEIEEEEKVRMKTFCKRQGFLPLKCGTLVTETCQN